MNHNNMNHDMHTTTPGLGGGHGSAHGGVQCGDSPMMMYFHTDLQVFVLIRELCVRNDGDMAGACIVSALLAIFYEGLKAFRDYLQRRHSKNEGEIIQAECHRDSGGTSSLDKLLRLFKRPFTSYHIAQSALHVIQTFWSLLLMMIFMTFNAWLCISLCIGAGVGHFIFGWTKTNVADNSDHCN